MSEDAGLAKSDADVVALVKNAIQTSREDHRRPAGVGGGTPDGVQQPGITIDLGHHNIPRLPDEAIEAIKDEIERLAISHNQITTFPAKLAECRRLRYLNARYNLLKELPSPVLQLSSLEILDISKNKLRSLPDEIGNLTSLKVLAISRNRIERLPVCLGDLYSLRVLKLDNNPLAFPPADVCAIQADGTAPTNEGEKEVAITRQVKKYLRAAANRAKFQSESEGETSDADAETPRPLRRAAGTRFPVKPSISGIDSLELIRPESPAHPPPIPTRSHFRNQSSQGQVLGPGPRQPPITPLIIANASERNRTRSESVTSATFRTKRMGMVPGKGTEHLGTVDENTLRRGSHLRGLSHNSALNGAAVPANNANGAPPSGFNEFANGGVRQSLNNQKLSDLLSRENVPGREVDRVIAAAMHTVWAVSQVRDVGQIMVKMMQKYGVAETSDLLGVLHDLHIDLSELHHLLSAFEALCDENPEEAPGVEVLIQARVKSSLSTCASAWDQILPHTDIIVAKCSRAVLRTAMLLLHGSTLELRQAMDLLGLELLEESRTPPHMERVTPTSTAASSPESRIRKRLDGSRNQLGAHLHASRFAPANSQGMLPRSNITSRSNTLTSMATPHSTESFPAFGPGLSRSNTLTEMEDSEEEMIFERVYLQLKGATEMALSAIPPVQSILLRDRESVMRKFGTDEMMHRYWMRLIQKCEDMTSAARSLHRRLSSIKLKDPVVRNQPDFWRLTSTYNQTWVELIAAMKEPRQHGLIRDEIKAYMKPLHRANKELSHVINDSPWRDLTSRSGRSNTMTATAAPSMPAPGTGVYQHHHLGSGYGTSMPATPLSAALGPAAQATVPSTPGTHTFTGPGGVMMDRDRQAPLTQRRI
ncbi:hypothetical protein P152DRAFT_447929 [Eremomyces bilateralis CBS 781.70]|uniref:Disease resistance R13L4/SHOC-2-like LRR domain-containing protein n=1 Tax=Eremomyces bilateralis CBS 781.70 TaxID=1392243 RepID=A0A6G1G998_9PEZI|nr:uncharacterized protein P152DRAFT_447929 [Eremomyces bilateralis CBS 781.70]KAF1814593.1 hypothetical protein P152DRAFT_447929 [Eremomyces bilateralis CBS 781.70]